MNKWVDDVVAALRALGGAGDYEEIYAEVAARRLNRTPAWKATVRGAIEQHSSDSKNYRHKKPDLFKAIRGIGNGHWALREYGPGEPGSSGVAQEPDSPQGYALNSVVRSSIERYAVDEAKRHYFTVGAKEVIELGKPYDLRVMFDHGEVHVEVKGSLRALTSVILTKNEVHHARDTAGTELVVVDQIRMTTSSAGTPILSAGRLRIWNDWAPSNESLVVKTFDHVLSPQHSHDAPVDG